MVNLSSSLLQLFERLRRQGVPLGVSDYLEAIATLQAGIGIEDKASFQALLRLLWAKSKEDQELFDTAFGELVEPQLQIIPIPEPITPPTTPPPTPPIPEPSPPLPETRFPEIPQQVSKPQPETITVPSSTLKQSFNWQTELTEQPQFYQLTPRLPMNRRDMAGVWRQLRRPQRIGVAEELDVEATINSICRTGVLLKPVLQPRRRNQAQLLILVDRQGSMTPFAPLFEAAIDAILRGGLLGKTSLYYFHDVPEQFLYEHPTLTRPVALEKVLEEQAKNNSVLIISDAGAARGYYDSMRVEDSQTFVQILNNYTYLSAWLNPMPKYRWRVTTAEDIASMIPMFTLNREGLHDAVNILRGHPFQGEEK